MQNEMLFVTLAILFSCGTPYSEHKIPFEKENISFDPEYSLALLDESIESDPGNAENYFKKASVLAALEKNKAAESYLLKALEIDQINANYQILLAQIYLEGGKFSSARYQAQKLIKKGIESEQAYIILTRTFIEDEKLNEAATSIREAISLNPNNSELHYYQGMVLELKDSVSQAISSYKKSFGIDRNRKSVWKLVNLYQQNDNYDELVALLEQSKPIFERDYSFNKKLAEVYLKKGYDSLFIQSLSELYSKFPENQNESKLLNARFYVRKNQLDTVNILLSSVLGQDSLNTDALMLRAEVELKKNRNYSALSLYDRILEYDSTNQIAQFERERVLRKITYLQNLQKELEEVKKIQSIQPRKIEKK